MNKPLLILAIVLFFVSVVYFTINNKLVPMSVAQTNVVATSDIKENLNVEDIVGTYTSISIGDDCEKELNLELYPDGKAYLTEEVKSCESQTKSTVYIGSWTLESILSLDLQDDKQNKFQKDLNSSKDEGVLASTDLKYIFKKTSLREYKSEFKSLVVEYGEFGNNAFVRLWAPNGVLLATLYKDVQTGNYKNELYSWSAGPAGCILKASTTEEFFVETN